MHAYTATHQTKQDDDDDGDDDAIAREQGRQSPEDLRLGGVIRRL